MELPAIAGAVAATIALMGAGYALFAADTVRRWRPAATEAARAEGMSVLRPLHGDEPGLADNLASFAAQDHHGPIQFVLGVARADDAALKAVAAFQAVHPHADIVVVVDPRRHGANAKLSQLVNMWPRARYDVIMIADSDVRAAPGLLRAVAGTLARPGVGLVSLLFRGEGRTGLWSRLAAMDMGAHFLPSVLVALRLGRADPCLGPVLALRRAALERVGGFAAFVDVLADDHALGNAVRAAGLTIAFPDAVIVQSCRERTLGELIAHEGRWARTVRGIDPLGYAGSVVTHPLPFALAAVALTGGWTWGVLAAVLLARWRLARAVEQRLPGPRGLALAWLPVRDLLSFAVFVRAWGTRRVTWRGRRFRLARGGAIAEV